MGLKLEIGEKQLRHIVKSKFNNIMAKCLDFIELAYGKDERFGIVRAKILGLINDEFRDTMKEMDGYDINFKTFTHRLPFGRKEV